TTSLVRIAQVAASGGRIGKFERFEGGRLWIAHAAPGADLRVYAAWVDGRSFQTASTVRSPSASPGRPASAIHVCRDGIFTHHSTGFAPHREPQSRLPSRMPP